MSAVRVAGTTTDVEPRGSCEARLTALRERAARVQHDVNNPLAALLAEAQLLELDPTLGTEHGLAVRRIIELCRRVVAGVRLLDEVRGEVRGVEGG
ncbi:MAG: hypothetical protein WKG32_10300 [Gemmatimonadaceae bacterium]